MKKVEAIIKPFKLDEVKTALSKIGVQLAPPFNERHTPPCAVPTAFQVTKLMLFGMKPTWPSQ